MQRIRQSMFRMSGYLNLKGILMNYFLLTGKLRRFVHFIFEVCMIKRKAAFR